MSTDGPTKVSEIKLRMDDSGRAQPLPRRATRSRALRGDLRDALSGDPVVSPEDRPAPSDAADIATQVLAARDQNAAAGIVRCRCGAKLVERGQPVRPVEIHQGRTLIRCTCGYSTRIARQPRAPESRVRPHMSKKDRRRQRARLMAESEAVRARLAAEASRGA